MQRSMGHGSYLAMDGMLFLMDLDGGVFVLPKSRGFVFDWVWAGFDMEFPVGTSG